LQIKGLVHTKSIYQARYNSYCQYSKSVRRDIKRIHADIDVVYRQKQSVERSLNESQKKMMSLEHSRDIRVGLELQLKELQEQMKARTDECKVYILIGWIYQFNTNTCPAENRQRC
jgi:peptidoglycan hydrolase CwlO-like protein